MFWLRNNDRGVIGYSPSLRTVTLLCFLSCFSAYHDCVFVVLFRVHVIPWVGYINLFQGEIYLGCIEQDIGLPSILRHATVYSTQEEYKTYFKNLKENQIFPDRAAVYVCPAAFYDKRMLFFDLDWSAVHKGTETDFDGIIKYIFQQVELNTKPRGKKRKRVCVPDFRRRCGFGN